MSVGVHVKKRRAKPTQLAQLIDKALAAETLEEIADHVNLQGTTILRKLLSLNRLPKEIQDQVHWGTSDIGISFSVAAEIARFEHESDVRLLFQKAIEHQLSRSEVQAIVQRTCREGCSAEDALAEILMLRPAIEQQYLFMGLLDVNVTDDIARRNIRRNLAELVGPENILSVRCREGRFSILLKGAGANSQQALEHFGSGKLQSFVNSIASASAN